MKAWTTEQWLAYYQQAEEVRDRLELVLDRYGYTEHVELEGNSYINYGPYGRILQAGVLEV